MLNVSPREFVPIFLYDRVRKELLTHLFHFGLGLSLVLLIYLQFHVLPDSHIARVLEPQRIERMLNRLALWIKNPLFERDMNLGFHCSPPPLILLSSPDEG